MSALSPIPTTPESLSAVPFLSLNSVDDEAVPKDSLGSRLSSLDLIQQDLKGSKGIDSVLHRGHLKVGGRVLNVVVKRVPTVPLMLQNEIEALKKVGKHPSIVPLVTFDETRVVLIDLPGVTLYGFLASRKKRVRERVAKPIVSSIFKGLQHCHNAGIGHHDVSMNNVVWDPSHPEKPAILLDFGFATMFDPSNPRVKCCQSQSTSYLHAPPEFFREEGHADPPLDAWAAGIILFVLLHYRYPFSAPPDDLFPKLIDQLCGRYDSKTKKFDLSTVKKITYRKSLSPEALNLLQGILERDVEKRLTIPEILEHPWLKA